ncbi:MAG: hypothetical protein ACKOET_02740 [Verrucomicrobiota bacterium]
MPSFWLNHFGRLGLAGMVALGAAGLPRPAWGQPIVLTPPGRLPAPESGGGRSARSVSGQFVIHGQASGVGAVGRALGPADDPVITVEPELLGVAAERVKAAVHRELGWSRPPHWKGLVRLHLQPSKGDTNLPIRIVPQSFADGWQYTVVVPDRLAWPRLVRGLVEVVLLELANREGGARLAQAPFWLNEGLSGLLVGGSGRDLIPEPRTASTRTTRRPDPLRGVREGLAGGRVLSFSELGKQEPSGLADPAAWAVFRANAALFTHELLTEAGEPARLRDFLRRLPRYLNWQTAFLEAYSGRFLDLLDVEKWWAVNASHVLAMDPGQRWTREVLLRRLGDLVTESAEIQVSTRQPPAADRASLARIVTEWDFATQRVVLGRKVAQLRLLYAQAPGDLLPLVSGYHQTLERYLSERAKAGPVAARPAARKLEELDRQLQAARQIPPR